MKEVCADILSANFYRESNLIAYPIPIYEVMSIEYQRGREKRHIDRMRTRQQVQVKLRYLANSNKVFDAQQAAMSHLPLWTTLQHNLYQHPLLFETGGHMRATAAGQESNFLINNL
jgi:hypothetical protein